MFPNITDCANYFNTTNGNIYTICKGNGTFHTIRGFHLEFVDYKPRSRKVICKTTGDVFNSQKECANYYGISPSSLSIALRNNSIKVKDMTFDYYDEKDGDVVCL